MRVVPGALLRIREYLVSRLNFCEELGRFFDVAIVAIWMELQGFLSVGLLDPGKDMSAIEVEEKACIA